MRNENQLHSGWLNEMTLLNFDHLGTDKQSVLIDEIIRSWDNRRYLKPAEKHFFSTPLNYRQRTRRRYNLPTIYY